MYSTLSLRIKAPQTLQATSYSLGDSEESSLKRGLKDLGNEAQS